MNFDQCQIIVNSKRLLATNISLSQQSDQSALYAIGNTSPIGYTSKNFYQDLNITYYCEPNYEPNYLIVSGWKNNITSGHINSIEIGNVVTSGYLINYSISLSENQPIINSAAYRIFFPLTGSITGAVYTINKNSTDLASGISHYWSAKLLNNNTEDSEGKIISLNYSLDLNILPIYSIGYQYPKQVIINNGEEKINIVSEHAISLDFSGKNNTNLLGNYNKLSIKPISSLWEISQKEITINMSGMNIISHRNDISLDNIVLANTVLSKSY